MRARRQVDGPGAQGGVLQAGPGHDVAEPGACAEGEAGGQGRPVAAGARSAPTPLPSSRQREKETHSPFFFFFSFFFFECHLLQLLACIGEQFADGDEICGAVVNVRAKQDKVCLWTRTAANEAAQVGVGKQLKAVLDLDSAARVGFLVHADAKAYDRSAKDRYIV